jgi:hypothetical protein
LCSYSWSVEGGSIQWGIALGTRDWEAKELIDPKVISWMNEYTTSAASLAGLSTTPMVISASNAGTVEVRQVASVASNLSSSKSTLFEVTTMSPEKIDTKYVSFETANSSITNLPSYAITRLDDAREYQMVWDYATVTYTAGNDVTILCKITNCERVIQTATLFISSYSHIASYNPGSRTILLSKDKYIPFSGSTKKYQAQLFNDTGYIKTVNFTSDMPIVSIPLNNLPGGNYYINVLDVKGSVVDRKCIPAY